MEPAVNRRFLCVRRPCWKFCRTGNLLIVLALVSFVLTTGSMAAASTDEGLPTLPTPAGTVTANKPTVCVLSTRPGASGPSLTNVWSALCDSWSGAGSGVQRFPEDNVPTTTPASMGGGLTDCVPSALQDRCEAWAVTYDSGPNGHGTGVGDQAAGVATSPNGDQVFVTGQVPDANTQAWKAATVAYDSDGELMWVAHFTGRHGAAPADIEVSSDGSTVFVIGGSANKDRTVFVMTAVAYDAKTGEERWVAEYGSKSGGAALALSPTGDELYVTGPEAAGDEGNIDFATVAFATSTGRLLWSARYDAIDAMDDTSSDRKSVV